MTKTMNDILGLDEAKCREIVAIKEKYIKGELTFEEARGIILQRFDSVTPFSRPAYRRERCGL